MTELQKIRKVRRQETGEDFTPISKVNEMLDILSPEVFIEPSNTFCDPAAGNGNFLVEVLSRKLLHGHNPLQAIDTIYGVELMPDNVEEMKERLLELIPTNLHKKAREIINHNIVCANSLEFDFKNWKTPRKSKKLF